MELTGHVREKQVKLYGCKPITFVIMLARAT